MQTIRSLRVLGLPWLAALLAAGTASGEGYLSTQVGGFIPWSGDAGPAVTLQMMGSNATGQSRFGGEFEFRDFDSRILGVPNVGVESYFLRGLWQYHFSPDAAMTPYLGLGLGIGIHVVNDDRVDAAKGRDVRGSTGAGLDGLFLMGLAARVPGVDYMSIFAEGRVGIGFELSGRNDQDGIDAENLGGASVSGGVRFRF